VPVPAPTAPPPSGGTCYPFSLSKNTTSSSACGGATRTYYLDSPDGLFGANVVYSNSGCGAGDYQSAGYFAEPDGIWKYWDGNNFTDQGFCSI
jgi:hypothetical protein